LDGVQKSGTPLDHLTLIQRCLNDYSILEFVCKIAQTAVASETAFKTQLAFCSVLATQVMAASGEVTENLLARIIPFIMDGLKSNNIEFQVFPYFLVLKELRLVLL
jgi:hypothetical protein